MATGNIEISLPLRPCLAYGKRALFHRWADKARGDHSTGQNWNVVGIVEYEDGSVSTAYPEYIQFLDSKFKEYAWPSTTDLK